MTNTRDKTSKFNGGAPILFQYMNFNLRNQLRFYLDRREMTAAQLARQAKVPKQSLSGWMAGKKPADISQVKSVANALEVTLDNLMFGSGADRAVEKSMELDALLGEGWISGLFEVRFRRVKRS